MLPACVKTEVWRELAESLSARLNVPVVCEQAVFGKLPFFQELRNRKSDAPYSTVPGIRYEIIPVDNSQVVVGPFKTVETHAFDEELADARQKLPLWKDEYSELIELAIKHAAIAGKSESLLKESLSRAKLLLEFSQSIAHVQDVDRALYTAVQFLAHKFKLCNVYLYAYNRKARNFDVSDSAAAVEQRVIAQVKGTKATCTIQNVQSDFLLEGIKDRDKLPKCIVGFPLTQNRELVGYAVCTAEQLPQIDCIAEVLYELVAELSRLSRFEKVQESAVTDALTGLSNRAELAMKVDSLIADLASKNAPISIAMMDVDNFKNFNDTKGHPEGDRILKSVAEIIRNVAPMGTLCCRYGGEEFMMVLPNYAQPEAKDIAEKLRAEVENNCELTISIGLITCMNSSVSRETLIKEADRALYRAKNLGKNKVVAFLIVDKNLGVLDA
ncbi:MAG: GGDEF domain-containing protein [Candidatus Woesearchaeota archaeon]